MFNLPGSANIYIYTQITQNWVTYKAGPTVCMYVCVCMYIHSYFKFETKYHIK